MHNINKFIIIIMYANDELFDNISTIAKMIMKTHLIDNLKVNMLINNDVFMLQKIKFYFINEKMIIDICQNFVIKIEIVIKKDFEIRRIIRVKKMIIILILLIILILIIYYNTLLKDKDFLFEFNINKTLNVKKTSLFIS